MVKATLENQQSAGNGSIRQPQINNMQGKWVFDNIAYNCQKVYEGGR